MKNFKLTSMICYTAFAIALVFIATSIFRIPIGTSRPNLGDAFIFLFSFFFGPIVGLISGSLGSFFSDLLLYPTTAVFTLIIKGLEGLISGLLFMAFKNKMTSKGKNILFISLITFIASLFMMGGYFISKAFLYGTLEGALYSLFTNSIQMVMNVILTNLLYPLIIRTKILDRLK